MSQLTHYLRAFTRLRIDRAHGQAPHKPVLLLAVLSGYQRGTLQGDTLGLDPELIATFMQLWARLSDGHRKPEMALPWFHLQSEGFWTLIPRPDAPPFASTRMRSLAAIAQASSGVRLDPALATLMQEPESNALLREALLQTYFPGRKADIESQSPIDPEPLSAIEQQLLRDNSAQYAQRIEALLSARDDDAVFLRSATFQRLVPKIYGYRCCATGWSPSGIRAAGLIEACHIVPFSQSHDDTLRNGIALSPTLHRAFDRGLWRIDQDYRIRVSAGLHEAGDMEGWRIGDLEGRRILLPEDEALWPGREQLGWSWGRWG